MEAVADLAVHLSRIVEVKSSEGQAVVNQEMAIENIKGVNRDGESLTEGFTRGKIHGGVAGQMRGRRRNQIREIAGGAVGEARSVVHVAGKRGLPWKLN